MVPYLQQALFAVVYYFGLVVLLRLAGKRLAGQITTFDLVINIQMAVVLQMALLKEGIPNAAVFLTTVFVTHLAVARACSAFPRFRALVRGGPRTLVRHGQILTHALHEERMTEDELRAGLRKLGHESPEEVELAVLEETGHISAVARSQG